MACLLVVKTSDVSPCTQVSITRQDEPSNTVSASVKTDTVKLAGLTSIPSFRGNFLTSINMSC